MRNKENTSHVVRGRRAITSLSLTYKISLIDAFLFFPIMEIFFLKKLTSNNIEIKSTIQPILHYNQYYTLLDQSGYRYFIC